MGNHMNADDKCCVAMETNFKIYNVVLDLSTALVLDLRVLLKPPCDI